MFLFNKKLLCIIVTCFSLFCIISGIILSILDKKIYALLLLLLGSIILLIIMAYIKKNYYPDPEPKLSEIHFSNDTYIEILIAIKNHLEQKEKELTDVIVEEREDSRICMEEID